jgi:hypothetical protein
MLLIGPITFTTANRSPDCFSHTGQTNGSCLYLDDGRPVFTGVAANLLRIAGQILKFTCNRVATNPTRSRQSVREMASAGGHRRARQIS